VQLRYHSLGEYRLVYKTYQDVFPSILAHSVSTERHLGKSLSCGNNYLQEYTRVVEMMVIALGETC
jgi:hypothetical protein